MTFARGISAFGLSLALGTSLLASFTHANELVPHFRKVMLIVFENTSFEEAMELPNFQGVAKNGALFTHFSAESHPSQPNYIAMVAGDTMGVWNDNNVDLDGPNLADLLEAQGRSWKVYAEGFPGNCFLGSSQGPYARKHVPFLNFKDIQENPERCARIVEAGALDEDIQNGALPDFSLYIPNLDDDGHDTDATYADQWLAKAFGDRLSDPRFINDLLFIVTFDEDDSIIFGSNQIYTAFFGPGVIPGTIVDRPMNHYNILKTIEANLGLGTLGRGDAAAEPIEGIWR